MQLRLDDEYVVKSDNFCFKLGKYIKKMDKEGNEIEVFSLKEYHTTLSSVLNSYVNNKLKNSRYYVGEVLLEKNKHYYFQSSNNKHIMASFETIVIIVGNDSFTQKYKIANILESVKKSFTMLMKPRIYND